MARPSQAIGRLNIPEFCWGQNVCNNVADIEDSTTFQIPPGIAATWNRTAY